MHQTVYILLQIQVSQIFNRPLMIANIGQLFEVLKTGEHSHQTKLDLFTPNEIQKRPYKKTNRQTTQ